MVGEAVPAPHLWQVLGFEKLCGAFENVGFTESSDSMNPRYSTSFLSKQNFFSWKVILFLAQWVKYLQTLPKLLLTLSLTNVWRNFTAAPKQLYN